MMRMVMRSTTIVVLISLFLKYADAENPGQKITIKFKYYTYDKDGTAIESGKYCNPGFEYVPDKN